MHNTKSFLLLFCLLFVSSSFAQSVIYYDKDWKETTKEKHAYYRPLPLKKVGELIYIKDYYKNGQLQYQGYSYADDENARVGDIFWYTEEGYDSSSYSYDNFTNTKELTYYYIDGKEWKKILYNNRGEKQLETTYIQGKKPIVGEYYNEEYYGIFNVSRFSQDYVSLERNKSINKADISLKNQKKYLSTDSKDYSEIIYWSNGNKAKEILCKNVPRYKQHIISSKYWDINGAPLNASNTEYKYYTKFGLAQAIKSKQEKLPEAHEFKDRITTYYSNGKIKKIRQSSWKNTEVYSYDEKGKENIQLFKEYTTPYDGFFTDTINSKITQYRLNKGIHIGEVITTKYTTDSIFAKGIYKDNKPYEGTFYNLDNKRMLSSYKDFLLDGVQIVYSNYYYDIPEEIYTMKKGVKDGYRKVYKKGVLIKEEEFKNGLPINGSLIEDKQQKNYKNGELVSIDYYKDKGYDDELRDLQYTEYYTKDQLIKVNYYTFRVIEDMQSSYTGFYNNGKPYNGYFLSPEPIIDNIYLVDYYENGVRLYQYSFDFLEQLDTISKLQYDQRTIFKNGKITTGYKYISDKGVLLGLRYLNGQINLIEINAFGMHAFNRNTYELKNNTVIIKNFSSPLYLKIVKGSKYLQMEIYDQNGKADIKAPQIVKDKTPDSTKIYYIEDNTLKEYNMSLFSDEYYSALESNYKSQQLLALYYGFPPFLTQTPQEYFAELATQYELVIDAMEALKEATDKEEAEKRQADIIEQRLSNNNRNNQFSFLKYNKAGKPSEGTDITKIGTTYKVDYYIEERLVKTITYKNLKHLQEKDGPLAELINIYNK
ncbi:MAG: hypothetical protein LBI72_06095 [Flavobacteriaceae bacterium]|jgi:hypothetical protein|nr:hypothetical protein [Flavobacteriaceae bacterium]